MTFEDMMQMNRLGETAVSPDGKWLAYSVTTVNLDQNTKTAKLWLQPIAGRRAKPSRWPSPATRASQFAPDGKRILFLSSRTGSQQIWLASFDSATGATGNPYNAAPADGPFQLTHNTVEPDNAKWSPDGNFIIFTAAVYPDCPAFTEEPPPRRAPTPTSATPTATRPLADSKVKAQIFTHLLYRHWNHYTGDKRSHLFPASSVETGAMRDLTPNDPHDVPPFSLEGGGGFAISPDSKELAFTENLDPEPAISTSASIFTLDLTNPAAKPVKVSTSAGGNFNPAYSPDGKYLAWRSQARAGYESDKFRLLLYDRAAKTIKDLLPKFDHWVDEFAWEFTSTDGVDRILFVAGEKGESTIYQINVNGTALRRLGKVAGEWSDLHYVVWQGDDVPGQVRHGWVVVVGDLTKVNHPSEVVAGELTRMDDSSRMLMVQKSGDSGNSLPKPMVVTDYSPMAITHLNDALLAQLDYA